MSLAFGSAIEFDKELDRKLYDPSLVRLLLKSLKLREKGKSLSTKDMKYLSGLGYICTSSKGSIGTMAKLASFKEDMILNFHRTTCNKVIATGDVVSGGATVTIAGDEVKVAFGDISDTTVSYLDVETLEREVIKSEFELVKVDEERYFKDLDSEKVNVLIDDVVDIVKSEYSNRFSRSVIIEQATDERSIERTKIEFRRQ